MQTSPGHLIIGDSIVKGLNVEGSISICRGGIRPNEVLQLLPASMDILRLGQYDDIRSVTLIALNFPRPNKGIPLLDVIYDYEKLIHDLRDLFPNAR